MICLLIGGRSLHNQSPSIRRDAVWALVDFDTKKTTDVLVTKALQDSDPTIRITATRLLEGRQGTKKAINALMTNLNDTNNYVQSASIHALGQLKAKEAVSILVNKLRSDTWNIKDSTIVALGEIGDIRAEDALINMLERELAEPANIGTKESIIISLGKIRSKKASDLLITLLKDKRTEEIDTSTIIQALSRIGDIKTTDYLIPYLKSNDHEAAITALGRIGGREATISLLELYKQNIFNETMRENITIALGDTNAIEAIDFLRKLSGPSVQRSLIKINHPMKFELISDEYRQTPVSHKKTRIDLLRVLSDSKRIEDINLFINTLKDQDIDIRVAAINALGKTDNLLALDPLITFLNHDNWSIRQAAKDALKQIVDEGPKEIAGKLIAKLDDVALKVDAKKAIIRMLGNLKMANVVPKLIELSKNEEYEYSIVHALAEINDKRAIPVFIKALRRRGNWDDYSTRTKAFDALVKIDGGQYKNNLLLEAVLQESPDIAQGAVRVLSAIGVIDVLVPLVDNNNFNVDVRSTIVKQLSLSNDPRALTGLITAAYVNHSRIKRIAIKALSEREGDRVKEVMIWTLGNTNTSLIVLACNWLKKHKAFEASEALVRLLGEGKSFRGEEVREAAHEALVAIAKDTTAKPAVIRSLEKVIKRVNNLVPTRDAPGDTKGASESLKILSQISPDRAKAIILNGLKNSNALVRTTAVNGSINIDDPEISMALLDGLNSADLTIVLDTIKVLGKKNLPDILVHFDKLLARLTPRDRRRSDTISYNQVWVKRAILESLKNITPSNESLKMILGMTKEYELSNLAIQTFVGLKYPGKIDYLVGIIEEDNKKTDNNLRQLAVYMLGKSLRGKSQIATIVNGREVFNVPDTKVTQIVNLLTNVLNNSKETIFTITKFKLLAADALVSIGTDEALSVWLDFIKNESMAGAKSKKYIWMSHNVTIDGYRISTGLSEVGMEVIAKALVNNPVLAVKINLIDDLLLRIAVESENDQAVARALEKVSISIDKINQVCRERQKNRSPMFPGLASRRIVISYLEKMLKNKPRILDQHPSTLRTLFELSNDRNTAKQALGRLIDTKQIEIIRKILSQHLTIPEVMKVLAVKKLDLSFAKTIYADIAREINRIHDAYERTNWQERINTFLGQRSDRELYLFTSYGTFELYTGTFNLVSKELSKRMSQQGGLLNWLKHIDRSGDTHAQFLLSLSSRKALLNLISETTSNANEISNVLKGTCDLIKEIILKNVKAAGEENTVNLAYVSNAVKEVFDFDNFEIKEYLKNVIFEIAQKGNIASKTFSLVIMSRYPNIFNKEEIKSLSPQLKSISTIINYLDKPDRGLLKNNKLIILVDYDASAEGYLDELKDLFDKDSRYNRRYQAKEVSKSEKKKGVKYIIEGQINGVTLEYHLAKDIAGYKFRNLIDSGKYSIVFTRHHSYAGRNFAGVGSDKVFPQIISTVSVGQGAQNNIFAIVLSEEVARGVVESKSWNNIWQNMGKRLTLDNFIPPNHLSFLMAYAMQIDKNKEFSEKDIKSIIIMDGGCGGINRIPTYIPAYKNAINSKTNSSSSSIIKRKVLKTAGALVLAAGISLSPGTAKGAGDETILQDSLNTSEKQEQVVDESQRIKDLVNTVIYEDPYKAVGATVWLKELARVGNFKALKAIIDLSLKGRAEFIWVLESLADDIAEAAETLKNMDFEPFLKESWSTDGYKRSGTLKVLFLRGNKAASQAISKLAAEGDADCLQVLSELAKAGYDEALKLMISLAGKEHAGGLVFFRSEIMRGRYNTGPDDSFLNKVSNTITAKGFEDSSMARFFYSEISRHINGIHDYVPDWQERTNNLLRGFNDKGLYLLVSYGGYELYTGTFNFVYEELLKRITQQEGLFKWLEQVDVRSNVTSEFLLALSSRNKLVSLIERITTDKTEMLEALNRVCNLIKKIIVKNSEGRTREQKMNLAYISNAIKELIDYNNDKIIQSLKEIVLDAATKGNAGGKVFGLTVMSKYPSIFNIQSIESLPIYKLIDYLNKPAYESLLKANKIVILVDYAKSSEGYLEELKEIFAKDSRYKYRYRVKEPTQLEKEQNIEYIIQGEINGITIEYHLAQDIKGDSFKKIIEADRYSLIFTRHHSYEGQSFVGVGSDKVLPQTIGTVSTGKGAENNLFAIVLSEELAKGVDGSKNWDEIWQNMKERLTLDNFIPPNHLSFLMAYAMELKKAEFALPLNDIKPIILIDGGCGGINRIPTYIPKYKNAINAKTNSSSSLSQDLGGIDLNTNNFNLDIRGQSSSSSFINNIPFNIQNFQGFTFQILKLNRNQTPESILYSSPEKELSHLP